MPRTKTHSAFALVALVAMISAFIGPVTQSFAATGRSYTVEFTDKGLISDRILVPAGEVVSLIVKNSSASPIEIESPRLHIEKIVKAGATIEVKLNRLAKGSYPFFDEFHEDLSRGEIVAE